jgi:predicted dehydrogenase
MPEIKTPTAPIFRLGRPPDPWEPPDWSRAHGDGTFGNRFDDPTGYYRVLYASSQRLSCFIETLAAFDPMSLLAELDGIAGEYTFGKPIERTTSIGEKKSKESFKNTDHFGGEMKYFSDCVLKGLDPEPDGEEGFADVRVLEGILKALQTGQSVKT